MALNLIASSRHFLAATECFEDPTNRSGTSKRGLSIELKNIQSYRKTTNKEHQKAGNHLGPSRLLPRNVWMDEWTNLELQVPQRHPDRGCICCYRRIIGSCVDIGGENTLRRFSWSSRSAACCSRRETISARLVFGPWGLRRPW